MIYWFKELRIKDDKSDNFYFNITFNEKPVSYFWNIQKNRNYIEIIQNQIKR